MGGFIDHNTACGKNILRHVLARPSKYGLHSCHKDLGAEGFGDIFVHSQVKTKKLVSLVPSGGEHNDRHFGVLPDLAAYLPAVHLRHHHVKNDKRDILFLIKQIHGSLAVPGFQYLEIFLNKEVLHQFPHPAFIIYNKNFQSIHMFFLRLNICKLL